MVSTSADIGSPKMISNIDTISVRRLIIAGSLCAVALLIAIIVGATGPSVFESELYNLYQCPNNSHIFTQGCSGQQLIPEGQSTWTQNIEPVSTLNKFWALQITPYSNNLTVFTSEQVTFLVTITTVGNQVVKSENTTQTVVCNVGFDQCNTFTIIDDEELQYVSYYVSISIVSNSTIIGDIDFEAWRDKASFSSFGIGVHLTLLIISCIGIVGYLIAMRTFALINWSFEQKFLFIIFFGLLLANNPFYGLQFATEGAFFPFLNAFFEIIFLSIFSLYSLMILDRIRLETKEMEWDFSTISKWVIVGIFTLLGIILFSWINVRDRKDPIVGSATAQNGIQALFYLVATIFICILLWVLLLIITTFPIAYSRQYVFAKYLFTAVPIVVYVFSILCGIFAGTFGPLNSNALSLTYFNVLNNVFAAIVAYSYWPNANPFHKGVTGRGEEQGLVSHEDEEI